MRWWGQKIMLAPDRTPEIAAVDSRPHAIVIGAGFAGLAAAIRLGVKGYRVTVLERLDQPGGRARTFEIEGYRFDAGPTLVTVPFMFEELWTLCGEKMSDHVQLTELSPCYRIRFNDGTFFDCYAEREQMEQEIARISPGDVKGYQRFMAESERCYKTGFVNLMVKPFHRLSAMFAAAPELVTRGAHVSVLKFASRYVKHPKLRIALSFHPLFIGGNPLRASALYSLISHLERTWGVHYPMGGLKTIISGLENLAVSKGATFRYQSTVSQIMVDQDDVVTGVELEDGETLKADIVVSNADSSWTHQKLLPEKYAHFSLRGKLAPWRYSMGLFVWYFGTNRKYDDVAQHSILLGPRYEELLKDIFDRKVLAEDFSLYLHRPTATDPDAAPAGKDSFYVLSPVPNLQGDTDWQTVAEDYRQKIARFLEETVLPDLSQSVTVSKIMTPEDFSHDYLSMHGAAFALEPTLAQAAYFRPHNKVPKVQNLFLVGAGTHPGAGMPGVLASAKIVASLVPDVKAPVSSVTAKGMSS